MGTRIELTPEQEGEVVVNSLMSSYEMLLPDYQSEGIILEALETVLSFYMTAQDWEAWKSAIVYP